MPGSLAGGRWWLATAVVLGLALAATVPTAGDLGLTWDEPAYRYSQQVSAQWWERLGAAQSRAEVRALVEPDALLYYWPYARHGINFHPPLAGQLSLATYAAFGRWVKDIPARRLASVFEYAATITLGFGFLARRYGPWVGGVMAGALLLMPRVYGDGHLAGTDTPGLLLWAATALAFWKGLHEPGARRWRVAVGVLAGLGFVEKMSATLVLGPLLAWLVIGHLPRTFVRRGRRADWVDGVLTTTAMLVPLAVASLEIRRLAGLLPEPKVTDLFRDAPSSRLPGLVLAVPLAVWVVRRTLGWVFRMHPVWGAERPALETWTAVLAFAPGVGWLGNPAWWRETLPRLAHYCLLNADRRGSLPDIRILYLGRIYLYSLPWHNAWVLIAITVPASLLVAAAVGVAFALRRLPRDRLPFYFLLHFATLPAFRMLPTPAHDGVRLLLPAFFFLAGLAGWGAAWVADGLARLVRVRADWARAAMAVLVLGPAARQLVEVHPFELSYYNELIGGPRGAWKSGFELSYWYDAFNPRTLAEIERRLPRGASVDFLNEKTNPTTFQELQSLGELRGDISLGTRREDEFPYVWLLTQDSKASAFTRLLFALAPWYACVPRQLDALRVATVADPVAVSRAWALFLLASGPDAGPADRPAAPDWVRRLCPPLGRFWGEGLARVPRPGVNTALFEWARADPQGLRAAAGAIAARRPTADAPNARRLRAILSRYDRPGKPGGRLSERLLRSRPEALVEAVAIVIARPDAVRAVLIHEPYTDPESIGGSLDAPARPATHPESPRR
ncbi:MAG: glycosyltransferase family 39 protein [Planctomycetaceae bacterium]|nr:glycosyltransferase family 39 protein [Planctomycetaceae bacterium]